MTVRDVLEFQRTGMAGLLSTAVGKYQILRGTLLDIVKSGTISLDDKFDDVTQDKAAAWLWNRRIDEGKGDVGRTMEALGNEWEIIKKSPAIAAEVRKSLEAGGMKYTGVGKPLTEDSGASDLDGALKVGRDRAAQIMPGNEEFANNVDRSIRTKYDALKAAGRIKALILKHCIRATGRCSTEVTINRGKGNVKPCNSNVLFRRGIVADAVRSSGSGEVQDWGEDAPKLLR